MAHTNMHGLCGKAGSDVCRIFHTESPGISPHKEEEKKNKQEKDLAKKVQLG